jgi:RHH-type rel operon transcriptional repressor/antitoxin RelB
MPTLTEPARTLNVRIPAALAGQLDALTTTTGRNKSALTVEALARFVEIETWQIQQIQTAIEEADRGEFATDQEVNAFFAKYDC